MADDRIHDPLFGELHVEETEGHVTYFRGEADLTPKHRVVIDFAHDNEDGPIEEGLAVARSAFERVRRGERAYRLASAAEFIDLPSTGADFAGLEWTPERVAALLTLVRVDVHADGAWVRLFYEGRGELAGEDLAVTFDEDGAVENAEDPYR
jgi:hypothetical protein